MAIYSIGERHLQKIGEEHFVADSADVIGDVVLENLTSIWFNVTIRAEHERVHVGEQSNVQDGAVLHVDPGFPLTIGNHVTIGHQAMVHGCTIGDFSLVGINAVVLNGAKIGRHCIIGANALVTEGMEVPDGAMVLGSPGKIKRILSDEEKLGLEEASQIYVRNLRMYNQQIKCEKS